MFSMHPWEAVSDLSYMMYATILGSFQGWDTFLQAAGSHLYSNYLEYCPEVLCAWAVSFQALCPFHSVGQSSGEDWSQVCHLVGVLWLLSCQIKRRCWQSPSQFVTELNLLDTVWENPSLIGFYRWFWQRFWILSIGARGVFSSSALSRLVCSGFV